MVSFEIKDSLVMDEENDFIYNHFHLTHPSQKHVHVLVNSEQKSFIVPLRFDGETAHLGIWLYEMSEEALVQLCRFVFKSYAEINRISFQNSPISLSEQQNCISTERNHWKILLPDNPDELHQRLSSKKRYNVKRQKRIAQEQLGDYEILEYQADQVPDSVINTYFHFKFGQFGTDYQATPAEYIKQYHVSHVYVLRINESIGAIVMSCEQGAYVYLENLAYNPEYSKYSLGAILYDIYLERLVQKRKKGIYLGYGHHQYKSMYGAVEQNVYTGTVLRSRHAFIRSVLVPRYGRKLRSLVSKSLRKMGIMPVISQFRSRIQRIRRATHESSHD